MRLSKLIVPMLYVGAAAATTCTGDIPGIEKSGVCCLAACGSCGGPDCGDRGGIDCCTSTIKDSGKMCSDTGAAPCIVSAPTTTTTPTTSGGSDKTCTNGLPGFEASGVCCEAGCGSCGGPGCGARNGLDCCTSTIKDSGKKCSVTNAAPCIVDNATPTTDTTPPTTGGSTDNTCTNGLPGFEASGVCCEAGCGYCGGSGCGKRNGLNCCTSAIKDSGKMCSSTKAAPCIVDDSKPTEPVNTDAVCSNNLPGFEAGGVCCEAGCGYCGGSGCGKRNGLNCCTSAIKASGKKCSSTKAAPCIVDDGGVTTPTPPTSSSYTYVGCFRDTADRVFGSGSHESGMTTAKCAAKCAGSAFFGTQYGVECWCSSDTKNDYDLHGTSSSCNMPCGGDSSDTCGGEFALSVYKTSATSPTPTPPTTGGGGSFTCDGVQKGDICCSAGCGECGGSGCGQRGGGLTGDDCCHAAIRASGRVCSATGAAPCVVDGTSPTPVTPTSPPSTGGASFTCSGAYGIAKSGVCCMAECGGCGGSGCASFGGGLGGEKCCTGKITASGVLCSVSGAAPCIIDQASGNGGVVTPGSGTPAPVPATPVPSSCSSKGKATIEFKEFPDNKDKHKRSAIVLSGGGCATLTDIFNAQSGEGSLEVLASADSSSGGTGSPTGYWLLKDNIYVYDDVTLFLEGKKKGGDCDVLRMESTSSKHWEIRAHGGNLYFHGTTVTSWSGGKVKSYSGSARSFIRCITEYDDSDKYSCDGHSSKDMGTCRMDIIESTMGELGWDDSESYGLTWKVRGLCTKTGKLENVDIFDKRNVYGDIKGSDIYGMYYGMYSYGHQGGVWTDNKMHDNIQYGFDPHDDSDYLTIANNEVYNNGNHGIIASKRCNNVKIYNNHVYDGKATGIMLHRSSDYAEVYDNYIHDNDDAGIAFFETYDSKIHHNTVENCKYGIRLSLGAGDNKIYDNKFYNPDKYGMYTYKGTDDESDDRSKDSKGRPYNNVFERNEVTNVDVGVQVKESDDITFKDNTFTGVKEFEFPDSKDTVWSSNNVIGNACVDDSADFASGSIPECD